MGAEQAHMPTISLVNLAPFSSLYMCSPYPQNTIIKMNSIDVYAYVNGNLKIPVLHVIKQNTKFSTEQVDILRVCVLLFYPGHAL